MKTELIIKNLHVSVEGKEILKGVNLKIKQGEIHALMGPNGSGKSTLSYVLMGHPKYKVEKGDIRLDGKSILKLSTDKRARLGLFLAFQYPSEVAGVTVSQFLRSALNARKDPNSFKEFQKTLEEDMDSLKMNEAFADRYLNEGFSGGEKKRNEILQMSVLKPKMAILDEVDSGTDIDALKVIAQNINAMFKKNKTGILMITHYNRILKYVKPKFVHVILDGKIVKSGSCWLAERLEKTGYENIRSDKNGR